jgi:hypothetical protein
MTRDEPPVVGLFPDGQARTRRPPRLNRLGVGAGAGAQPLKQVQNQALDDVGHKGFCGLAGQPELWPHGPRAELMAAGREQVAPAERKSSRRRFRSAPEAVTWSMLARAIAIVAKRSRRPTPAHERSPSNAITPIRRPSRDSAGPFDDARRLQNCIERGPPASARPRSQPWHCDRERGGCPAAGASPKRSSGRAAPIRESNRCGSSVTVVRTRLRCGGRGRVAGESVIALIRSDNPCRAVWFGSVTLGTDGGFRC